MLPVAARYLALALPLHRLTALPSYGTAAGRVSHEDLALAETLENFRRRMPEPVAVARLHDRQARCHRIEEERAGGCLAAMVGHQQHVGAQPSPGRQRVGQGGLLLAFDIARKQRLACRASYAQHARQRIA